MLELSDITVENKIRKFRIVALLDLRTDLVSQPPTMSEYHAYTVRVIGVSTHEDESGPYTVRHISLSQSQAEQVPNASS